MILTITAQMTTACLCGKDSSPTFCEEMTLLARKGIRINISIAWSCQCNENVIRCPSFPELLISLPCKIKLNYYWTSRGPNRRSRCYVECLYWRCGETERLYTFSKPSLFMYTCPDWALVNSMTLSLNDCKALERFVDFGLV